MNAEMKHYEEASDRLAGKGRKLEALTARSSGMKTVPARYICCVLPAITSRKLPYIADLFDIVPASNKDENYYTEEEFDTLRRYIMSEYCHAEIRTIPPWVGTSEIADILDISYHTARTMLKSDRVQRCVVKRPSRCNVTCMLYKNTPELWKALCEE
jgi:hypothetical protein